MNSNTQQTVGPTAQSFNLWRPASSLFCGATGKKDM